MTKARKELQPKCPERMGNVLNRPLQKQLPFLGIRQGEKPRVKVYSHSGTLTGKMGSLYLGFIISRSCFVLYQRVCYKRAFSFLCQGSTAKVLLSLVLSNTYHIVNTNTLILYILPKPKHL